MEKIICLTDYKNHFGSKCNATPYRSGFDKDYLERLFKEVGYKVEFISMSQVDFLNTQWKGRIVLYSSSEEYGLHYKYFIEDVVYGLKEAGARLIPDVSFLRAHNNKVFMEILRKTRLSKDLQTITSHIFGTYDELDQALSAGMIDLPCVIKKAAGGMSRGVFLAKDERDLRLKAKKISHKPPLKVSLKEKGRLYKHKGYKPESDYQGKFIIQPLVSGLKNDWKILVFGDKYYIFERPARKNDFRASGSGSSNYIYGSKVEPPDGIFDFAKDIYTQLKTPHASLDIAFNGDKFYLFEFQCVYFGTVGQYKSDCYYYHDNGSWHVEENKIDLEQVYVHSIVKYIKM